MLASVVSKRLLLPPAGSRGISSSTWQQQRKRLASPRLNLWLQKATDLLFFHSQAVMGLAAGGLVATTGAIVYYKYERGEIEKFLSKTDRIKLERAEHEAGGYTIPLPLLTFTGWACLGVLTAVVSRTKANLDLNFRQFASRVNYSLNSVARGQLSFRTIQEKSLEQLLLGNSAAISVVKQAVKKVTDQDPFLRFPPAYNFFVMNAVLNDLSSLSAMGFFQADRGIEVDKAKYILGLTFERNAPFKKLRVMLASEELLQQISSDSESKMSFEEPVHSDRWEVMKLMSRIYKETGVNNPHSCLWKVEIAVPKGSQTPTQGL